MTSNENAAGPTRTIRRAFVLLAVIDIVLIGVHIWLEYHPDVRAGATASRFVLGRDHGVPESFNHLKWISIAALMVWLGVREQFRIALSLAWLFFVTFLDDFFLIHEEGGIFLARELEFDAMFGLRPRDFGELSTWAVLGLIGFVPFLVELRRSTGSERRLGRTYLLIYGALLTFAIVIDMVHVLGPDSGDGEIALGVLEDGGEMIIGSLAVAIAIGAVTNSRPEDPKRQSTRPETSKRQFSRRQ